MLFQRNRRNCKVKVNYLYFKYRIIFIVYIAGIDIGTTSAIVLLDENGKVIEKISKKNFSEEEIVSYLNSKRYVIILATDKAKVPSKIKKIAARLNLGIYCPKKDLSLEYKSKFYRNPELKEVLDNIHEFDAYIAAYYTLENIKDIIRKARKLTDDEMEKTRILKECLKENKVEPVSVFRRNLEVPEEKPIKKKRRKKKTRDTKEIIEIVIKKSEGQQKENPKVVLELNKKITKYINIINNLSNLILEMKTDKLIPKLSYLTKAKKSCKRVFIDKEENLNNISNYKEIYISQNLFEKLKDKIKHSRIFIVKEYEDLYNFIIPKEAEKIEISSKENLDEIKEKIKKIILSYRY